MTKTIMVQGTASNAGKSLIAAGLCRVLAQDGYRVAPFKSQNMALNSYITSEGLEMGRAQVMQAEAAGIAPRVDMNPILLKPVSDEGSQVIVNGEVLGTMTAAAYYAYKDKLVPYIMEAFSRLARQFDVIVLEGAGSPAEINLKQRDIVNMGMARMAESPVLLVGDIDRGGVFASLAGTLMLLDEEERRMVKGLLINKFRGDVEILRPGLSMLEEIAGVPVLGVVPYLHVDIDDEDSLSERLEKHTVAGAVDIAVIRLPRLSNFTDFNVFATYGGVSVRYVKTPAQLKQPDMVILPGTKNTMGDLKWLRESGMEAAVKKRAVSGTPLFGICGGYQMLGQTLADPNGVEGGGSMAGIGLLPCATVFEKQKTRTRVTGEMLETGGTLQGLFGAAFEGYEIHMGKTVITGDATPLVRLYGGGVDGCQCGNVYGCYIHGLFDSGAVSSCVIAALCARKGIDYSALMKTDRKEYACRQYDLLADGIRRNVDMDAVYRILEAGL
ncbi:MAG TPA: cobyric acid synthase CobQ [Clostridiales bacterium]|nr:cobyric acid synthase CobQ [Clostridiales bacterium]